MNIWMKDNYTARNTAYQRACPDTDHPAMTRAPACMHADTHTGCHDDTGNHTFLLSASGRALLRLRPLATHTGDPAAPAIAACTSACPGFFCSPQQRSAPQTLSAGAQYLLEVRHAQWGRHTHVGVAAITPSTAARSAGKAAPPPLPLLYHVIYNIFTANHICPSFLLPQNSQAQIKGPRHTGPWVCCLGRHAQSWQTMKLHSSSLN